MGYEWWDMSLETDQTVDLFFLVSSHSGEVSATCSYVQLHAKFYPMQSIRSAHEFLQVILLRSI